MHKSKHEASEAKLIGQLAKHARHAPPHKGLAKEKQTIRKLQTMERREREHR
jgi:hypothetical protein